MLNKEATIQDFEKIYNELGNKKIKDLNPMQISKYLLVAEELTWMDCNVGDDKVFYTYDEQLLEKLSYTLEDSIVRLIHEEILYDNDLHTAPDLDDLEY